MIGAESFENKRPQFVSRSEQGDYPRLPVEAVTREGSIEGIMPGAWKFMHASSLVVGEHSLAIMLDTIDKLPEDQTGKTAQMAVMRVDIGEHGERVEGYVVDCRYGELVLTTRDVDNNPDVLRDYKKYKPVIPLAVAYKNRLTGNAELAGDDRADSALRHLMQEVDAKLHIMGIIADTDKKESEKKEQEKQPQKSSAQHLVDAAHSLYMFTSRVLPIARR